MSFELTELRNSTIWQLYRMRDRIQIDPDYQRLGNIWAPDNRQLLIDTILNGFDVPKLYLHKFTKPVQKGGKSYDYAIIDGRQRLETMWNFIGGKIALADDFTFYEDDSVKLAGMTYQDLGKTHPELKADFDGFPLAVVLIETDDLEMIEEMFSRLNEAAPLTAAEKRNAYGGPVPVAIRKLAKEPFFTQSVPFPNKRYRHFDLVTKFLLTEHEGKVVDTKKARLDDFVDGFASEPRNKLLPFQKPVQQTVQAMHKVFADADNLLRQVGMVTLYYHLFRLARAEKWLPAITRKKLFEFDKERASNRILFELGETDEIDRDLIEFDGYAQSPNDAGAIRFRLKVMLNRVFGRDVELEEL